MGNQNHQKAEEFRRQIALPVQRNSAISELLTKSSYDESDKLRIKILFQKKGYLEGCKDNYKLLIAKVMTIGDEKLAKKATTFLNTFSK